MYSYLTDSEVLWPSSNLSISDFCATGLFGLLKIFLKNPESYFLGSLNYSSELSAAPLPRIELTKLVKLESSSDDFCIYFSWITLFLRVFKTSDLIFALLALLYFDFSFLAFILLTLSSLIVLTFPTPLTFILQFLKRKQPSLVSLSPSLLLAQ